MSQKLKINNPDELADGLKDAGIPFKLISTTFTKTITVSEDEIYYYSSGGKLKRIELNLIKMVKEYCEDHNFKVKVNKKYISYIRVNDNFKNGIHKRDLFEIDLKAAYWNLAYRYKYISKAIYNKGLNLDAEGNEIKPKRNKYGNICNHIGKTARLIALGNLAKTYTEFTFDGKKYRIPRRVRSEQTENIFFKVSSETDAIMKMLSILAGDSYLFYWVDAIYVRGQNAVDMIADYLTNTVGIDFKIVPIYKLLKTKSYITVWDETNVDENENMLPRPYIFKSVPKKDLESLLDIDKNIIYKEHYDTFFKKG